MDLVDGVALVAQVREPRLVVLGLLDLSLVAPRLAQLNVAVKPGVDELEQLVLGLAHDVRDPMAALDVRGAIRQDNVLCGHKQADLTLKAGVVVDLLERRAGGRQAPQHLLVLGPVLDHLLGELVVHVRLHPGSGLPLLGGFLADDFGQHRTLGREGLHDGLRLESDDRLGDHGVHHATGAVPRLRALLVLQPQQLEPVDIRLLPVLAAVLVVVDVRRQLAGQRAQVAVVHLLGKVVAELAVALGVVRLLDVHIHALGPADLDFDLDRGLQHGCGL